MMARYRSGRPTMVKGTPTNTYSAGDVIVQENLPLVAHVDNPPFGSTVIVDSLSAAGGVYVMTADAAYKVGTYVYWDPTAQKVTTANTNSGCVPFGWIVGGPTAGWNDGGPATSGDLCEVLHLPQAAPAMVLTLGATANDNITNTSSETAFATTAVIPAGTLQAGDVVHVRAVAQVTAQNSTNTNQFKLKISTAANTFTTVVDATALNIAANGLAVFDIDFLFSAVGNSGAFTAWGAYAAGNSGGSMISAYKANTAINTTLAVTVEVTDTQSAAAVGNVAQLTFMDASIRRK